MFNKESIFYSVCFLLFIDAIGGGLTIPILPALFLDQKYGFEIRNLYFARETLYGLSLMVFPLASIFGMPILGQASDRYGKEKIMLYGLIGIIVTDILSMISIMLGNVWLFLFSRLLVGFLSGTYAAGMAMISDISNDDEDRIYNFKLATLASLAGALLGPGISIFVISKSFINPLIAPFFVVTVLGILNFVALWFNFNKMGVKIFRLSTTKLAKIEPENPKSVLSSKAMDHHNIYSKPMMVSCLFYVLVNINTRFLFVSFFFFQFGLGLYIQSLSLFLVRTFGYTPQNVGMLVVVTSLISMLSMYLLQPLLTKYYNYRLQVKASIILIFVLLVLYAYYSYFVNDFTRYENISVTVLFVLHVFIPFVLLGFTNLFANSANVPEQGRIMGGLGQISAIAIMISALLMGKLLVIGYFVLVGLSAISMITSYVLLKYYLQNSKVGCANNVGSI